MFSHVYLMLHLLNWNWWLALLWNWFFMAHLRASKWHLLFEFCDKLDRIWELRLFLQNKAQSSLWLFFDYASMPILKALILYFFFVPQVLSGLRVCVYWKENGSWQRRWGVSSRKRGGAYSCRRSYCSSSVKWMLSAECFRTRNVNKSRSTQDCGRKKKISRRRRMHSRKKKRSYRRRERRFRKKRRSWRSRNKNWTLGKILMRRDRPLDFTIVDILQYVCFTRKQGFPFYGNSYFFTLFIFTRLIWIGGMGLWEWGKCQGCCILFS